jgi:hypothetical protein
MLRCAFAALLQAVWHALHESDQPANTMMLVWSSPRRWSNVAGVNFTCPTCACVYRMHVGSAAASDQLRT